MSRWWEHLVHIVTGRASRHTDLPDLRRLSSQPVSLERTHYLINDRERQFHDDRLYVLRREPQSRRDSSTVAVYSNGRGVGYLPARSALALAPLLDLIGGAALVNGAGTRRGSIRLWVHLPTESALGEFVRTHDAEAPIGDEDAVPPLPTVPPVGTLAA